MRSAATANSQSDSDRDELAPVTTPTGLSLPFDAYLSAVRPAYQPIVDLVTGDVVAFEALARWPELPGATPDRVFSAARAEGRLAELDWACRAASLNGALEANLGFEHVLFVNVEPETLGSEPPEAAAEIVEHAHHDLRVMWELTERSLTHRPAELLRLVAAARANGWGIALDDVGAEPASLALLPFLAPDVVKLDMALIRHRPNPDQAAIMTAVMAHAERTGAIILAEGIETVAHLDQALALGARLGQGWLFAKPGPLRATAAPRRRLEMHVPETRVDVSPFDVVAGSGRLGFGRKALLIDLSHHLERFAAGLITPPVVLGAFQTADRFTPATATRYTRLGATCPLVAAFGVGLGPAPAPGVFGADLAPTDPLCGEWTVTVVGPHFAGALIARDLGDDGPDLDRRFEFAVTHDRDLVLRAARSMMARITSQQSGDGAG
jgi:EAL domain-containing protein (putative c-di-GMP-specific phosphodiesterase class I)